LSAILFQRIRDRDRERQSLRLLANDYAPFVSGSDGGEALRRVRETERDERVTWGTELPLTAPAGSTWAIPSEDGSRLTIARVASDGHWDTAEIHEGEVSDVSKRISFRGAPRA
jgi:hypothetical protein